MQVLKDERGWLRLRQGLDVPTNGEEEQLLVGGALRREAEEDGEVGRDLIHIFRRQQVADMAVERVSGDGLRVGLEDPRDLFHLLTERAVAGRFSVGEATTFDEAAPPLDRQGNLTDQPAFSDARSPAHGDHLCVASPHRRVPDRAEKLQLCLATDQRHDGPRTLGHGRSDADDAPHRHRLCLALQCDRRML